ncbi:hypothetical protein TIFTF001_022308 [Ficus carica]|uniref:Uncharacterized protein n=1 Tax=Ficus carica TaxID=3494 RepID=A0AA88ALU1_FICCA|nr:hypothetical protein TIFTF001_022308 [Ficus carica]
MINIADHENLVIIDLLKEKGLFGSMLKAKGFVGFVVREFYSNLASDIGDSSFPRFNKVYVRGHVFDFLPAKINSYLDCLVVQSNKPKELDQEYGYQILMPWANTFLKEDFEQLESLLGVIKVPKKLFAGHHVVDVQVKDKGAFGLSDADF